MRRLSGSTMQLCLSAIPGVSTMEEIRRTVGDANSELLRAIAAVKPAPTVSEWAQVMELASRVRTLSSDCEMYFAIYLQQYEDLLKLVVGNEKLELSNAQLRQKIPGLQQRGDATMEHRVDETSGSCGNRPTDPLRPPPSPPGQHDVMLAHASTFNAGLHCQAFPFPVSGQADQVVQPAARGDACREQSVGQAPSSGPWLQVVPDGMTTLVLHDIPRNWGQEDMLQLWPPHECMYDYLYLPFNIKQRRMAGYAFVNFLSWHAAEVFRERWQGHVLRRSEKVKYLRFSVALMQGAAANLQYLKENNIEGVENDKYFPALFEAGRRVPNLRGILASLPPRSRQEFGP